MFRLVRINQTYQDVRRELKSGDLVVLMSSNAEQITSRLYSSEQLNNLLYQSNVVNSRVYLYAENYFVSSETGHAMHLHVFSPLHREIMLVVIREVDEQGEKQ